jgi:16S rRNA (uracil1498-N3)-methyltransferase
MEFVIEKATELGASAILPVAARRSVSAVRTAEIAGKMKRWRAISIEAAKQCGASWLPVIEPPQSFGDFLQNAHADLKLIAALDERAQHPRKIFEAFAKKHGGKPETIVVAIGPEGDFTAEELDAAIASGFAPISLGAQTLRSETAAVVALSVLNYEMMV